MHRHGVENLDRADIKSQRNKEWKDEEDPSRDSTKDSESVPFGCAQGRRYDGA
jgi:hypothetical protein